MKFLIVDTGTIYCLQEHNLLLFHYIHEPKYCISRNFFVFLKECVPKHIWSLNAVVLGWSQPLNGDTKITFS